MPVEPKYSSNLKVNPTLVISEDGLIRLTYEEFKAIPLVHLYSELNLDITTANSVTDGQTLLCGLTEWVSNNAAPVLSIGWGWKFDPLNDSSDYEIDGQPFSNIMFVDESCDQGKEVTLNILTTYINQMDWSESVKQYLNEKYS